MGIFSVRNLRAVLRDEPDVPVFDVREADEFLDSHIAGTIHLPLARLLARDFPREFRPDVADEILIVCRSGKRAAVAVDSLRLAGYTRSFVVDGGLKAWIEAGFPVVGTR